MKGKLVLSTSLLMLLFILPHLTCSSIRVEASNGNTVINLDTLLSYSTIQAAVDANETLDGHIILVEAETYVEHVTVHKALILKGEDRSTTIISGNGTGTTFHITASNVIIANFTIKNGSTGIYIDHSNNTRAMANNVIENSDGIIVRYSYNCTIQQNTAGNNTNRGILISNSANFTVSNNQAYRNSYYGINANSSSSSTIKQNSVYENYFDGIGIFNSNDCTVIENNVTDNVLFGVAIERSNDILIYHNNVISDSLHASSSNSTVAWDDGSEGNYWSDYDGNDANFDGIGDTPYYIDETNIDHYPLINQYIIPEFSSTPILLIFLILTSLAIIIHKKKMLKSNIASKAFSKRSFQLVKAFQNRV